MTQDSSARGADPIEVALQYPAAVDDTDLGAVGGGSPPGNETPATILRQEQLRTRTEWVEAGRVRLRRRIVTERRTIQVDVRREIVEVAGESVDFRDGLAVGTDFSGPAVPPPPERSERLVAVLREEVPVVTMAIRPYERLVLSTELVPGRARIRTTLDREEAVVDLETAEPNSVHLFRE